MKKCAHLPERGSCSFRLVEKRWKGHQTTDIETLETGRKFAKTRILGALALGRLPRSPLYHELQVPEFAFESLDGPIAVAHDGEVGHEFESISFTTRYRGLPVFRPLR